jgi:transcriptional repressor NrdR
MVCPYCHHKTQVLNSRLQRRNNQTWRRRRCIGCNSIFTSHEAVDYSSAFSVRHEDGFQPFLTDKLRYSLVVALKHRKDCYNEAGELTQTIIKRLLTLESSPAFTRRQISQTTTDVLKKFDQRAWHRYRADHPSA